MGKTLKKCIKTLTVFMVSILLILLCVHLTSKYSEKLKWIKIQKKITDECIYAGNTDRYEFDVLGHNSDGTLGFSIKFPERTNSFHPLDIKTWHARKSFYCDNIIRFRDKLQCEYFHLDISEILKDEPYFVIKEITIFNYQDIEEMECKIGEEYKNIILNELKDIENKKVYYIGKKYITFLDFDRGTWLLFDAQTGERICVIPDEYHTDTVYMPEGVDGQTKPKIYFEAETGKLFVVYKCYNNLYIRRLN